VKPIGNALCVTRALVHEGKIAFENLPAFE
jgi:hypothetical protein